MRLDTSNVAACRHQCNMTFEQLFCLQNLNNAFYECTVENRWKETTQRYRSNLLLNNLKLMRELQEGTYRQSPTNNFRTYERGKLREIHSPAIRDRIVQKILCKYILVPQLKPKLIYDNYACLEKRGTDMARRRVYFMLQDYIEHNGTDGYVVQVDIEKYFDNISHKELKRQLHETLIVDDKRVIDLIDYYIDHMTYEDEAWLDKGLNLGSEIPQICSSFYMHTVDNYVKCVKSIKHYGRYADDSILFVRTKDEAWEISGGITEQLKTLGLKPNEKKTRISKLSKGFTFLKIKYDIIDGAVVTRLTHSKIHRTKNKMKAYKRLVDNGEMIKLDTQNSYKSMRKRLEKEVKHCHRSIGQLDNDYYRLFGESIKNSKRKRKQTIIERNDLT